MFCPAFHRDVYVAGAAEVARGGGETDSAQAMLDGDAKELCKCVSPLCRFLMQDYEPHKCERCSSEALVSESVQHAAVPSVQSCCRALPYI